MALKEAYRPVTVREGDKILTLPAIQAVLRSQVLAAKGNGPAQRALIEVIQAIERELAAQATAKDKAEANKPPMSDQEIARRIAFPFVEALSTKRATSTQPACLKVADRKRRGSVKHALRCLRSRRFKFAWPR